MYLFYKNINSISLIEHNGNFETNNLNIIFPKMVSRKTDPRSTGYSRHAKKDCHLLAENMLV